MPIVADMSDDAYFAHPALSQSMLKQLGKPGGAAKLKFGHREPTEAQRFGTLIHRAILQPALLPEVYAVSNDRRGSVGWLMSERAALGREVVTRHAMSEAGAIAEAVRRWSTPARLLLDTAEAFEVACFWQDHRHPTLTMKAKVDAVNRHYHAIVDIKSTVDASPAVFRRACLTYGYDLQAAHYLRGWNEVSDWQAKTFIVIAVEKTPPYMVAAYEFAIDTLVGATAEVDRLTDLYVDHSSNDNWPGYPDSIQTLDLNREAR